MKNRVLVVCARRYNGHELWTALGVMVHRGHSPTVVSTDYIIQDEITLRPNRIDKVLADLPEAAEVPEEFDALMIVSGNMADTEAYWSDKKVLKIVDAFEALHRPIAAICCSVPTVRNAAKNKKVSYFPLVRSKHLLVNAGALPQTVAMTRCDNLVTAEHQMATEVWAEEFCNLMEDLPQQHFFHDSGFVPKGRERKPIPEVERLKKQKLANRGG